MADHGKAKDATLFVRSTNGLIEKEYDLSGEKPFEHLQIPVNNANDLQMTLKSSPTVRYGFLTFFLFHDLYSKAIKG